MTVSFMLTWEFLQSRWVAKKVSDVATKYITEVLNAEVEFENLQFNLFPPGANVKNVNFILKNEKVDLNIKANSLGVYFNPLDVFETDFIADRVVLEDGRVCLRSCGGRECITVCIRLNWLRKDSYT